MNRVMTAGANGVKESVANLYNHMQKLIPDQETFSMTLDWAAAMVNPSGANAKNHLVNANNSTGTKAPVALIVFIVLLSTIVVVSVGYAVCCRFPKLDGDEEMRLQKR